MCLVISHTASASWCWTSLKPHVLPSERWRLYSGVPKWWTARSRVSTRWTAWRRRSGCSTQTKSSPSFATSSWAQGCNTYTRTSSCSTTLPPAARWFPSLDTTSRWWTAQSNSWKTTMGIGWTQRIARNFEICAFFHPEYFTHII